ncbi:hypothetical protein Dsin_006616 [Dipteronia sinensis]|uniref:Glutathione S-transferase n=1 Tax=Dipteronia sinensis TaxID=43782 RepID=A0AAE0B035_9ROSI|nr:hypothetical protein Dsin_006616 [Dipteronia sinensis]
MEILEKGIKEFFPDGAPKIDGQNLELLDIMVSAVLGTQKANEQVQGVKILDPERFPLMVSWVHQLNELPLMKEVFPPHDKLLAFLPFNHFFFCGMTCVYCLLSSSSCVFPL